MSLGMAKELFELSRLQHRRADQQDRGSGRLLAILLTSAPEHIHASLAKLVTEEAVDERVTCHGTQSKYRGEVHENAEADRLVGKLYERSEQHNHLKR